MASRNLPQRPSSEALAVLIQKYFLQLTHGCGNKRCDNPDCATGSGKPLNPTQAATRAMFLVQNKGRLCERLVSPPRNNAAVSSTQLSGSSDEQSLVSQEVGGGTGHSESTVPHSSSFSLPSTTEPMELALSPTGSQEHPTHLVIGSSSSSVARQFSRNHSTTSSSGSQIASLESQMMSSGSTVPSVSSNSSVATSALIHMASSNMVEEVAKMEVSPSPHPTPSSSSSSFSSPHPTPTPSSSSSSSSSSRARKAVEANAKTIPVQIVTPSITEASIMEMIDRAKQSRLSNCKEITSMIWLTFSNPEAINKSFLLPEEEWERGLCKETRVTVDVGAARRTFDALLSLDVASITNSFVNSMDLYASQLKQNKIFCQRESLNHIVTLLENPQFHSPEFMTATGKLLQVVASLPVQQKETLVHFYSSYSAERLREFVSNLHQLITMRLLFSDDSPRPRKLYLPQTDALITASTTVMMIFFFASLLLSKRSKKVRPMSREMSSIAANPKPQFLHSIESEYDQLLMRLQVHPDNIITPVISWEEFLNEELNSRINMALDYRFFGDYDPFTREKQFAFLEYPFILNTANKVEKLLRDNLVSHFSERQRTFVHAILTGVPDTPFLHLQISREEIVSDTLSQLEAISELNPVDLRKQLRVEFKGEDGLDEGGVQKEFFQLLIEQLLDPMYGLFMYNEDTRLHWFNPASFETEQQFRLIGLLFGLAIYNNVILDVHFPMVVYLKLLGCQTVFQDLFSSHPQVAQSLESMLLYEGEDFEETFMASFQVTFSDMFGTVQTHNLREDGDKIPVTLQNRHEYVDEYTDWLLNKSIASHFNAFKVGFDLVMGQNSLADFFRPEEVEMMVCGSNEWDIDALEESTRYDGFTAEHPVIVNFWQIVREFSEKEKKQLLQFITGSDRIPLGGLAKLKFIIVKNGPDSDRLPTAHTCFNALLMCEYSNKEKLRERLTKAISYAKGFGML